MKASITYNPYKISTKIIINGESPREGSELFRPRKRFQEWVDALPQILLSEYRANNWDIDFYGAENDYDDLVTAIESGRSGFKAKTTFHKCTDLAEAEASLIEIYHDFYNLQNREPDILKKDSNNDVESVASSVFEVSVIGSPSSGKSTMINALLGKPILPVDEETTPSVIVRLLSESRDNYVADAINKSGQSVSHIDDVTEQDIKILSKKEDVESIIVRGAVPFANASGIQLMINDISDDSLTYGAIENSEQSLVICVLDGQRIREDDCKTYLSGVSKQIARLSKNRRNQFLFVMSKADNFSTSEDGDNCIQQALNSIKEALETQHIFEPVILPVASTPALALRTSDEEDNDLILFKERIKNYPKVFSLDEYEEFSKISAKLVKKIKDSKNDENILEISTGIVNIEHIILNYINNYGRPARVYDLAHPLSLKLEEIKKSGRIANKISWYNNILSSLTRYIEYLEDLISPAKKISESINNADLVSHATEALNAQYLEIEKEVKKSLRYNRTRMEKDFAIEKYIELQTKSIELQERMIAEAKMIEKDFLNDRILRHIELLKELLKEMHITDELPIFDLGSVCKTSIPNVNLDEFTTTQIKVETAGELLKKSVKESINETIEFNVRHGFPPISPETLPQLITDVGIGIARGLKTEPLTISTDYINMSKVSDIFIKQTLDYISNIKDSIIIEINKQSNSIKSKIYDGVQNLIDEKESYQSRLESAVGGIQYYQVLERQLDIIYCRIIRIIDFEILS